MLPHHSSAFIKFIEPANERSEIWRTIVGFTLVIFAFLLGATALSLGAAFVGELTNDGLGRGLMVELQQGETIFATLMSLGLISLMIPSLWLVLKFLHKRPLNGLLGPTGKIHWKLWRGAATVILVLAVVDASMTYFTTDLTQQLPIGRWLLWLLPSLALLFTQTTAEEMLFRGYLQQQLAARFKSKWVWWVMPSVVFGLFHWNPGTFGPNAWMVVATTTLMGLILADVTARFGSLSPAMGLHFANNLVVMLLMNSKGQLSGMSLYLYDIDLQSPELGTAMLVSLFATIIGYGIFMVIMRQRRL